MENQLVNITEKGAVSASITADKRDYHFAVLALLFGYLFTRIPNLFFLPFSIAYCVAVLIYAKAKYYAPAKETFFWFAVCIACAFSIFPGAGGDELDIYKKLLMVFSVIYGTMTAFKGQLEKRTGDFFILDVLNAFIIVPMGNFFQIFTALFKSNREKKSTGTLKSIILAVIILVPMLGVLVPMLIESDSGLFRFLFDNLGNAVFGNDLGMYIMEELALMVFTAVFWVPVAFYMAGLTLGFAHKRRSKSIDIDRVRSLDPKVRVFPVNTTALVLIVISAVYLIYIACQIPYFFSAFEGRTPAGYEVYSSYARDGFFSLVYVAVINIGMVTAFSLFTKEKGGLLQKTMNCILLGITLLILATAFSKMCLYISVYGFTQFRYFTGLVEK